ncbi:MULTISPECIES: hypothetical protein [Aeromonas]|uniref:hypothetical protein n=1 Tax=Aeromonas TaxID=642 RepID=UPI0012D91B2E|nr:MULTISPECIES: hypothetical protein [Aeromonas]MDH0029515.1 hypothetical protein [Aeromonas caviae]MDH1081264.1 hypothetical protein [Aeromonas caviae]MUG29437.1 hypothetical protein [Aeromonas salmonicida]
MNPQDLATIEQIVQQAIQNTEFISKVWIAGAAVIVSLFAALVGSGTQMLVARGQRRTQLKLAEEQTKQQQQALNDQLSMQELASRRIANANVTAKRQIWIDELRKDIARYLSLWQDISYRWDAIVSQPRSRWITDKALQIFQQPIAQMRMEALELQLRIELRLNMTEVKHQDLKKLMVALEDSTVLFQRNVSNISPKIIQTNFKKIHHDIIIKTQEILKEEWERVKVDSYADPNIHSNI